MDEISSIDQTIQIEGKKTLRSRFIFTPTGSWGCHALALNRLHHGSGWLRAVTLAEASFFALAMLLERNALISTF
jgi:hypothetical protein